jgi:3',5'-cyclic AMP phosphodiesterase CpdA
MPGGGNSFLLAHLSDPHLSSLSGVRPAVLLNKRLLGYLSWFRRRRHIHSPRILGALLRDLAEMRPDHVAVTGDLTHLGLPDEFHQAARWLERVGAPERVMVVPGNHDTYVATSWQETFGAWAPYLMGDEGFVAGDYPSLRVRGGVALIGLSTARPSMPFLAVGSLGRRQLSRLEEMLEQTGRRGLLRIVLLHHPPLPGSIAWRKRLTDAGCFGAVIARQGVELILHGHAHVAMEGELVAGTRTIPVFGVPSASDSGFDPRRSARYHLYRFQPGGGGWMLSLSVRSYSHRQKRFVTTLERELALAGPPSESVPG